MKKAMILSVTLLAALGFVALPALALEPPVITLERVDVATIQPFYVNPRIGYKSEKEPGEVKGNGYSSTLNMAYVLNIKNPNRESVMLDELSFTTAFDGFDINTALVYDDMWIPSGKTNQLRVIVSNEALPTVQSLSVGADFAERLRQMNTSPGALVSKWWTEVPNFSFPITLTNGTAVFNDEKGKEIRVSFSGKWPQK